MKLIAVEGIKLRLFVETHNSIDLISRGKHGRFIINKSKFGAKINAKKSSA